MAYKSVDYLEFDSLLNEQELLVRSTARAFASECEPLMKQGFRDAEFPLDELRPQLGELGFFGANLEGYGCPGMSSVEYGLIMQELERCDSGLRSFLSVQGSLAMQAIHSFGSEEQKQKYLPGMAQGKIMGCFGLTEPAYGSNPSGMSKRVMAIICSCKGTESRTRMAQNQCVDTEMITEELGGALPPIKGIFVFKSGS